GTEQKLGQLKIVRFPEKNGLRKIGENLFYATKESGTPEVVNGNNVIVRQGYIERSNVNVVNAMVKMIEVNRAYEANSRVIQSQDSALGQVINQVGSR
nr:flagellar hook-basal body complex protein [bacterium]